MLTLDYKSVCKDLISHLSDREKQVIKRRFGLEGKNVETLQAIGDDFGVTRERIRQIEKRAINKIKEKSLSKHKKIFDVFFSYFKKFNDVVKEEKILKDLGKSQVHELLFLLSIDGRFFRINEDENFYSLWTTNKKAWESVKSLLLNIVNFFKRERKLMSVKELSVKFKVKENNLCEVLEISRLIGKNKRELYGLREWPEINPKRISDKAYLVFQELKKPLHFTEIAKFIERVNVKSLHNELIKDQRFVLVGRGIYALREWGYFPGDVKDVIFKFLQEEGPLTKEEIFEKIKKQRFVKESTVLINLAKYFKRENDGKYRIKTAQI